MKKTNKKGFTIVELVIVIAVIAILAAVLIPTFTNVVEKANISAALQGGRNAYTSIMAEAQADWTKVASVQDGNVVKVTIGTTSYDVDLDDYIKDISTASFDNTAKTITVTTSTNVTVTITATGATAAKTTTSNPEQQG